MQFWLLLTQLLNHKNKQSEEQIKEENSLKYKQGCQMNSWKPEVKL